MLNDDGKGLFQLIQLGFSETYNVYNDIIINLNVLLNLIFLYCLYILK